MSSIMDWVKTTIGMPEEDDDREDVPAEETSYTEPTPINVKRRPSEEPRPSSTFGAKRSKVVNINTTAQLKVVVVQPMSYNDAPEIADHLKSKKPVVVNLEKLDKATASKIVDFLSGAVFALDGSMQKVAGSILLVVPNTMGIMGDIGDELKTQGLFDLF